MGHECPLFWDGGGGPSHVPSIIYYEEEVIPSIVAILQFHINLLTFKLLAPPSILGWGWRHFPRIQYFLDYGYLVISYQPSHHQNVGTLLFCKNSCLERAEHLRPEVATSS